MRDSMTYLLIEIEVTCLCPELIIDLKKTVWKIDSITLNENVKMHINSKHVYEDVCAQLSRIQICIQ